MLGVWLSCVATFETSVASESARISQCFQIKVAVRTEALLSAVSQRLFLSEVAVILGAGSPMSSINEELHEFFPRKDLH